MTTTPRSITILGAGPAGLYFGLLVKKADPAKEVTIIERNPAGVTYGWGVVFSDRTLASFQRADYKTYQQITEDFVIWDAIDVKYRGETVRCGGHIIAAISRKRLLEILQNRCAELGVRLAFGSDITDLQSLPECDLLVAADGVHSLVREEFQAEFRPKIESGKARYIWLGANKVLDAFNFIFHENQHGLFQVHAYPFSGTTSTFIVECDEQSWLNAGLDKATEDQSLAYCQSLLQEDLGSAQLLSNNSKWINFPTLKTRNWQLRTPQSKLKAGHVVLLGDAVHTAHFSIGAGTKLAMEDAIALAGALEQYTDVQTALNEYETERKPVVETFQRAAAESQLYFETIKRYLGLEPVQFAFQLLTRSGRISYTDLHLRDPRFGDMVDRWFWGSGSREPVVGSREMVGGGGMVLAPPPVFAAFEVRGLRLRNRIVSRPQAAGGAADGMPGAAYESALQRAALAGAGLVLTDICAVSAEGRITPEDSGLYNREQAGAWARVTKAVHAAGGRIGVQLGHAGRRGSTRPRHMGLDRPLREGNWPLVSASPIPYGMGSQLPAELDRAGMDRVLDAFVEATGRADSAGFDLLQLHFAHGYLLASFLSPLTNRRKDEYGGGLDNRMRFPLEVFQAVRAAWPGGKPLSVALTAADCARGGLEIEDAIKIAQALKAEGCDLIETLAGQTTPDAEPAYNRGFLTPYSDRVRNGVRVPTMVGGYITTSDAANTVLAAGRGDLCILSGPGAGGN